MFDSFQIISNDTNTSNDTNNSEIVYPELVPSQCQGLIPKLDARLVNGEINTQQYDVIKQKIGC